MEGMKIGDPYKIVMGMIRSYVQRQYADDRPTMTAELLANTLTGVRWARYYRVDLPEPGRNLMAREMLRGVITDRPGV